MSSDGLARARKKMVEAGVHPRAIDVFAYYYGQLEAAATGMIPEASISPLGTPTKLADLTVSDEQKREALAVTAIIKLNGGLGTSMGMDKAKSLLPVRDSLTFLDIIARQVQSVRADYDVQLPLILMNSFRTREDTLAALAAYPDLAVDGLPLDFLQNREPKLTEDDLEPAEWPADPSLEWCPPGHGDLYSALDVSGTLQALLDRGFRYASVSNSDNLGATPDPTMAGWFAHSGAPYAAEVCRRTAADVKGGYLVVRNADNQLILRETAQTLPEDADEAADINKHRYFHTNNLWFDLRAVAKMLEDRQGVLGLPLIRNVKTVDPADSSSPKVIQIETAMGAAVEVFPGATAIEVERSRFLPVKTTNDLLLLRSDFYSTDQAWGVRAQREDAPRVTLDPRYYKLIHDFDRHFPDGAPSLAGATSIDVVGDWVFGRDVRVVGAAALRDQGESARVPDGATLGAIR